MNPRSYSVPAVLAVLLLAATFARAETIQVPFKGCDGKARMKSVECPDPPKATAMEAVPCAAVPCKAVDCYPVNCIPVLAEARTPAFYPPPAPKGHLFMDTVAGYLDGPVIGAGLSYQWPNGF